MEVNGQLHAPAALFPGESAPPSYPLDRLSGFQIRSGHGGEENKSDHCSCLESNSGRPARSLVTILTELFSYHRPIRIIDFVSSIDSV